MGNNSRQLELMVRHYKSIDFGHWYMRILDDIKRISTLKTQSRKNGYTLDLYSAYIQLAEILIINMKIATTREREFTKNLFISNQGIHDFLKKDVQSSSFTEWFLLNYDFGIQEKEKINNYKQKYTEHAALLEEVIKDYLRDYQFLNAYKHGYRVTSVSGKHLATIKAHDGSVYKLGSYDASFEFTYKEYDGKIGKSVIYESNVMLNMNRVVIKAMFITGALENIKSMLSVADKEGQTIKLTHFYFKDKTVWDDSFDSFRNKSRLAI